ncbi:MAG: argininosuccinate lyase [Acidimicrobiaceae bacterium]|nr:argininosuccinate lyase [Acidimicrobiaceae bacterium]MDQ1426858.1 argininosuccinate lyase [Acidimicrobiaceae bacterium]
MSYVAAERGPSTEKAAAELVESGFALENADAPLLHRGLNLADMAHVIDLRDQRIIPEEAARQLLGLLLDVHQIAAQDFPYDPNFGEPYNSREHYFVERLGDVAGWLHAGRPRREAARIALRLHLRRQLIDVVDDATTFVDRLTGLSALHLETLMPDQTYLQQAQPSTFGHYALSFAYPALRDIQRLLDCLDWVNSSPGGAGCVNGSRLLGDRGLVADLLGFSRVIEHTRDAMWQVDGLISILSTAASLLSNQSKLAEDLEIWSSAEFDYVDLAGPYTRSSILMPQKRNPYSLSIVRGASGILIGRLSGFLAVVKSPSARSDNLIFAYGEVPRTLDLALRVTRLMTGVVSTLRVNKERMAAELNKGFSQATDLAEFVVQRCGIDYRTAYVVVGETVRAASRRGLRGVDITGEMLDDAAVEYRGHTLGLAGTDLTAVLDPRQIVLTRTAQGGAAPAAVDAMIGSCRAQIADLRAATTTWRSSVDGAETELLAQATKGARR